MSAGRAWIADHVIIIVAILLMGSMDSFPLHYLMLKSYQPRWEKVGLRSLWQLLLTPMDWLRWSGLRSRFFNLFLPLSFSSLTWWQLADCHCPARGGFVALCFSVLQNQKTHLQNSEYYTDICNHCQSKVRERFKDSDFAQVLDAKGCAVTPGYKAGFNRWQLFAIA